MFMRLVRALLVVLVCLALPWQGLTRIAEQAPCPLESAQAVAMPMDHEPGCCNDADTAAKTGKLCKTDSHVHADSAALPNRAANPAALGAATAASFFNSLPPPSSDPAATWRPPNPA